MNEPTPSDRAAETPPPHNDSRHLSRAARGVERRVLALQTGHLQDKAWAVADLAKLRRAAGTLPGVDFGAWTSVAAAIGDDLGEGSIAATRRENAAHASLTLYSLHQQSKAEPMHAAGRSIGHATRVMAESQGGEDGESLPPVLRRFHALGTAQELDEVLHHLRSLVLQFRSASTGLDYALLTDHLIALQNPHRSHRVRLAWGRDYYRTPVEATADHPTATAQGDPS